MPLKLLLPIVLFTSGCGSVSLVQAVATSADGKAVVVVGARYWTSPVFKMTGVDRPFRWLCARSESGDLSCKSDETKLPQID